MAFSPTDSRLNAALFHDSAMAHIFSDEQFVRYLLAVEVALATAQTKLHIIPADTDKAVAKAVDGLELDWAQLQLSTDKAGFPIIELVRQLKAAMPDKTQANYVHWGATTQDIMDTALVLQMRDALTVMAETLRQTMANMGRMAACHRTTVMAGRTHSQQALPISFGLKVANWLAPLVRHRERLAELKPRLLVVQFGGAAGTLASLGDEGAAVQHELAATLGLGEALLPWHNQRDTLVEVANWLSMVSGSLAKMAQDIILMAQSEVGEVRESSDNSRGGSSTMPQKSNPIVSELIVAAARTNASLLSSMHHALVHEHERATHGWQLEWLNLPQMFALTAVALKKALFLSENLVVNKVRMVENVQSSYGLMMGEAISFALSIHMSRADAKGLIRQAGLTALAEKRHVVDVLQETVDEDVAAVVGWDMLRDESQYLGMSDVFIDCVLSTL
ncbi:MAG: 3-carboxy-cis,cis-muconate cycloisomerase [Chloroflexota bacterium]